MSDALNNAAKVGWTPPTGSPPARALAHVAARTGGPPVDPTLRVTLNFHPDRLHWERTILAALAADGVYRSQFETATSNGGLTAHPGGVAGMGESPLRHRATTPAAPSDRRTARLNYRRRRPGGPRVGSAHLRSVRRSCAAQHVLLSRQRLRAGGLRRCVTHVARRAGGGRRSGRARRLH